jgi:serpin B
VRPRRTSARALLAAFGAALVAALASGCGGGGGGGAEQQTPKRTSTSATAAVASSNGLAVDLLRRLGTPVENTVFSPYSVQAALAMVDAGAAGETATQMNRVLRSSSASALGASNATLANDLEGATHAPGGADATHGVNLSIANSLWLQSGLEAKHGFTDTLARDFAATAQQLDFAKDADGARVTINKWIADRTAGHIQGLMPPGSITGDTKLVLANAVYLRAHWEHPFDKAATSPGPFFTGDGTRRTADIMGLPATPLPFAKSRRYEAVELPYERSTLSMLIVMPPRRSLPAFQRGLTPASLGTIVATLHSGRVKVLLPKFHLTVHTDLVPALASLGMPVAFSARADFSGITTAVPLAIGTVQHGAEVRVDEQGTVAAAATGAAVIATAVAPVPAPTVNVNHPFLLFLRDRATGAVLFAGRVNDPTAS